MIRKQAAVTAVAQHATLFFDASLNPVVPKEGDWFCEFDDGYVSEQDHLLRDEAIVQYLGEDDSAVFDKASGAWVPHGAPEHRHLVAEDDGDARRPRGVILIKQH